MNNEAANRPQEEILGRTESLCPVCLRRVAAQRIKAGDDVYLRKTCPEHGDFQTIVWRGRPDYLSWRRENKPAERPRDHLTGANRGCPYDCGLCPEHCQQICCLQIEVTARCNLACPICFADAGKSEAADPPLEELLEQLRIVWHSIGKCNIQLSGGEPTVRDDLPQLIRAARELGYTFFQLNSNGIRLGEDPAYVKELKEAGLSTVFMQFDGVDDNVYRKLRGRVLLQAKRKAIENCARYRLGVVLVPTLVPGVNTGQLGEIVRFALRGLPVIRGVHFQPISYFGRYPKPPADSDRITLPEVMRALEEQTGGLVKAENFAPSDCEDPLCSFHGDFIYTEDGGLLAVPGKKTCRAASREPSVVKARNYVDKRWRMAEESGCCGTECPDNDDSWAELLERIRNNRLSITCMIFQDAENIDLERLKYCCIPVISHGRAIPFCAYNLTNRAGEPLHRGRATAPPRDRE